MDLYIKGEKKIKGDWLMLIFSLILLLFSTAFFFYTKYPDFFITKVSIEKNNNVSPGDRIVIDLSRPLLPDLFKIEVKTNPSKEIGYILEDNNKKIIIIPKNYWSLETKYEISISGKNVFLFPVNEKIYFETLNYPKLSEIYPARGEKDVVLDIEDPIRAYFGSSIDNFKIKFEITPYQQLDYQIDNENNIIKLLPNKEIERGKKINIGIYIRHNYEKEENYRKIGETFFETKSPPPVEWDKNFEVRIEQAKKFTEAKIKNGKYIDINLKSQIMTIFENGKTVDSFLISSGKRGMETPKGNFEIHNKNPRAWSKKYGLFMPYWMAIVGSGDFGIHELPEWPGGYKEGQNHLGIPVSHGCVRLGVGSAERVYNWAEIGTPVVIYI